jgi:hypothetical protein
MILTVVWYRHYKCSYILAFTTLKMSTREAETCRWSLYTKLRSWNQSAFFNPFHDFFLHKSRYLRCSGFLRSVCCCLPTFRSHVQVNHPLERRPYLHRTETSVSQLEIIRIFQKTPEFCGNGRFITVFTRACRYFLSQANPVHTHYLPMSATCGWSKGLFSFAIQSLVLIFLYRSCMLHASPITLLACYAASICWRIPQPTKDVVKSVNIRV